MHVWYVNRQAPLRVLTSRFVCSLESIPVNATRTLSPEAVKLTGNARR